MKKIKIISIVGARPQFIKLAAMHRAIKRNGGLNHVIVHSGQHYDFGMSGQFFEELGIPTPDYNLEIGSGHHIVQMAKCMTGLIDVFDIEKPDIVLVYGDTNTTAGAAICTAKCNLKLAHIEAGLREWDKTIPEEVNKLLTDAVSDLYFTPTNTGLQNLLKDGKTMNVYVTGDISLDLLKDMEYRIDVEKKYTIEAGNYYFMTCHRTANTDHLENLFEIMKTVERLDNIVIWPMHPRTRKAIDSIDKSWSPAHLKVVDTCGFFETQCLIKSAKFVITDSGGIIKECYFHKVPAVIIDKQTEWLETVSEGWNTIAGPDTDKILKVINDWRIPDVHTNSLGDGLAGDRIVKEIVKYCIH